MRILLTAAVAALMFAGGVSAPALAKNVKITPIGPHDGELCRRDRALLFEDPDGTTLLFDPGRTVAGAADPRLPKKLDVVLLSSVHGDHQGDKRIPAPNAGTCGKPKTSVKTLPNSNTVEIAVGKNSKIVSAGQMRAYLVTRMVNAGADKKSAKKAVKRVRPGGKMKFGGVTVATVSVEHANGASPGFIIDKALAASMKKSGLTAYVGPDNGFILTFSNGLVIYLSADTGHVADMDLIVRRYYKAQIAFMNAGDVHTMGPEEAAWAVNELVKPKVAFAVHLNEVSTKDGKVKKGSKLERFNKLVDKSIKTYSTLSGVTMAFDGNATCVTGCK
ncbi:MAG: metal-dependent hydrolase [Rhodospirillaceae bacterium]|nr:metal-dependent hydrolase [Rhodospirillaceae bacterium]HAA92716.1 metal-dependent hydrolase [Rhodospirillaceae bacterium]